MQSTAIIIFAYSAKEESKYKRLASDPLENLRMLEKMNDSILSLVKRASVPYFIFNEHNQMGYRYGERMANAVKEVYAKGFENVIVVGNDCPKLELEHLDNAITLLNNNRMVIGPDQRGGVYLFGISKAVFTDVSFIALHWESNLLCHDLKCYNSSRVLLPELKVLPAIHSMGLAAILHVIKSFASKRSSFELSRVGMGYNQL